MDAEVKDHERHRTEDIEVALILEAIYRRYQVDFRGYAPATIARQLARAKEHFRCSSLSMLQHRLLHEPSILPDMVNLLTIQVSDFFRDPSYFRTLREQIVPHLGTYPSLKVWVAGCGDGEELYSLAILFHEEGLLERTIFYATDINPAALRKAENGVYGIDRIALFTENHRRSGARASLSEYYTAAYGRAVFDRALRRNVVFADHSLASDEVFAEVHFISCRNVLIYFERDLQERAIGIFGEALVRGGFLGLGAKESLRFSHHAADFTEIERGERIYRKTSAGTADKGIRNAA